jgi:hypothetical protein
LRAFVKSPLTRWRSPSFVDAPDAIRDRVIPVP